MGAFELKAVSRWANELRSLLRVMAAGSFFTHGTMKLFSWPSEFEYPMNGMLYVAGLLEVVGGILLLVGFLSRPISFLLSGLMAFAYFIVHASGGFFPVLNHGEAAMLYCFIFLYLAAAGPGSISVDALLHRSRSVKSVGVA